MIKRTGQSRIAVVGWGRGMGHKGHMYLADAVIEQAKRMNADPYFFVSKTVGKDDPILPEEKIEIYQRVFPQQATIFTAQSNLNDSLKQVAELGYQGVVVVVGADQKAAFQYLEKANKEGVPVYKSFGFNKLKVISRQETVSQYRNEEGPRATPMREILLNPNANEKDKFNVWRRDMPDQLSDREVFDLMHKAESRLVNYVAPKVKKLSSKANKLKESIINFRLKKAQEPEKEKEPEPLGYQHLFKQPDQTDKPVEKQYHGWEEYQDEKEKKPDEVEEARILNPNSRIDAYYVLPNEERIKLAKNIPYSTVDFLIQKLRDKKYDINMANVEIRPASNKDYYQSTHPVHTRLKEDQDYLEEK